MMLLFLIGKWDLYQSMPFLKLISKYSISLRKEGLTCGWILKSSKRKVVPPFLSANNNKIRQYSHATGMHSVIPANFPDCSFDIYLHTNFIILLKKLWGIFSFYRLLYGHIFNTAWLKSQYKYQRKGGGALSDFSLDFHNPNELEKFLNWIHFIK